MNRTFPTLERRALPCAALLALCIGGLLWAGLASPGPARADKKDHTVWRVNVRFVNGSRQSTSAVQAKVNQWVARAERVYRRAPSLDIVPTVVAQSSKAGRDLSNLVFDTAGEYARFMDENFDNVAVTRTEGHLTVLITDKLCIGKQAGKPKCWGGYANFPHWVNPFSRKRGVTLVSTTDENTLAHELGHVFGLKHTFEPYVGLNLQCNEPYKPKGKPEGLCNSCGNGKIVYTNGEPDRCDGPANIMDYCSSTTGEEFLNPCQETRAANQRYVYMTADGATNYWKLKGLAGEAICEEDADCDEGRFCDTGTAGVGRNQCKPLKELGAVCTRAGECASDRCSGLRCAQANECEKDADCGAGRYCNLGIATIGRNTCEAELADGRPCTGDHQCSSGHCSSFRPQDGQLSGICYEPASRAAGAACTIDLECKTGACNSQKRCVCKSDGDCGSGQWCDKGVDTHANSCKPKLASGEVCGTVGELGVGHRCKSGQCKVSGLSTKLKCK